MNGTIKQVGDHYVIEVLASMSFEPKLTITHYRIAVVNGTLNFDNPRVTYSVVGTWRGLGFEVGTNELPESVTFQDIPKPKTKLETRWNEYLSCWEKYSKAKGWIIA